jgi:hypothetical protein
VREGADRARALLSESESERGKEQQTLCEGERGKEQQTLHMNTTQQCKHMKSREHMKSRGKGGGV